MTTYDVSGYFAPIPPGWRPPMGEQLITLLAMTVIVLAVRALCL